MYYISILYKYMNSELQICKKKKKKDFFLRDICQQHDNAAQEQLRPTLPLLDTCWPAPVLHSHMNVLVGWQWKALKKQYNINETHPPTVSKCWLLFSLSFSFRSLNVCVAVIRLSVTSYRIITCYQSFEHTKHKMQGMYYLSFALCFNFCVLICTL